MDYMHIIALWIIFVLLVAIYLIAKVWLKEQKVGHESDFITDFIEKKKNYIYKNNIKLSFFSYMVIMFISPIIVGILVFIISRKPIFSIIFAMSGLLIPDALLTFVKNKENKDFEDKYERSLEQLSSALKAGMSVMQAVKEVSENKFIYEPLRQRYANLYADLTMGVSLKNAFYRFAESTNLQDAYDIALIIDVQSETGGREGEAIALIARDIRDRLILRKEIKSMFASTTGLVYVMDILPLGVMIWLTATNKSYLDYYFSGIHIFYMAGLVLLCLTGSFLNHRKIRKILKEA